MMTFDRLSGMSSIPLTCIIFSPFTNCSMMNPNFLAEQIFEQSILAWLVCRRFVFVQRHH
jgi:hypothetical protein